jgi:multiple sugar transport system substrate-binding protein
MNGWRRRHILALAAAVSVIVTACSSGASSSATTDQSGAPASAEPSTEASAAGNGGPIEVSLWTASAGAPDVLAPIKEWIDEFNKSQTAYEVKLTPFPDANYAYTDTVVAAALSKSLPCLLDVDGPNIPSWANAGYLQPLNLPDSTVNADFLPSMYGKWQGKLYGIGRGEDAIALYARKSDLQSFGIRIPTLDAPWTGEEFQQILDTYKNSGKFTFAFDPGMAWTGEWYPYAFSPFLQSFGGDLIDRSTFKTADGALNGPAAVAWGDWWQKLFAGGYAPGTSQTAGDRDTGFVDGKYGLQWNGDWAAPAAQKALGDDLLFLPAPDFGKGPKIGAGSWQWSISSTCDQPEGANAFINFAMQPEQVAKFADSRGSIPSRSDARPFTTKWKEGTPLGVFYDYTKAEGLIRPPTPGYPKIAKIFEKAAADIANGAEVQSTLDQAVDDIDADIEANNGYGF